MKFLETVSIIISVLLALPVSVQARPRAVGVLTVKVQEEAIARAREFDEYEMNRARIGDMKARLDGFYEELQKEPGARAHIFIYGGKRAAPRYRSAAIRDYLELRGLPRARMRIVRGGNREEPMLEFWVVPDGAEPPKATPPYQPEGRRKR